MINLGWEYRGRFIACHHVKFSVVNGDYIADKDGVYLCRIDDMCDTPLFIQVDWLTAILICWYYFAQTGVHIAELTMTEEELIAAEPERYLLDSWIRDRGRENDAQLLEEQLFMEGVRM